MAALYLNVFVLVVQAFLKVPALKELAPTQKEPPFLIAQLVVLLVFIVLTILAAKRSRVGRSEPFDQDILFAQLQLKENHD